jgi:hypothetical protein
MILASGTDSYNQGRTRAAYPGLQSSQPCFSLDLWQGNLLITVSCSA